MGSHVAPRAKRPRQQDRASFLEEIRDCVAMFTEWTRLYTAGTVVAAKSVAAEWKDWPRDPSTD